jgi:hypothetical protein
VGAIPFLQRSIQLAPAHPTAQFNRAVAYLLAGDYARGWPQYETRWNYEHLAGTLPKFDQPRWTGQDIRDRTVLVIGEQGHGDSIQFVRFLSDIKARGARTVLVADPALIPLFTGPNVDNIIAFGEALPEFDYWTPIMSIPGVVGSTLDNLASMQYYLTADAALQKRWQQVLGPKTRLRVGFCWSGRRDTWINRHKAMPFEVMLALIRRIP